MRKSLFILSFLGVLSGMISCRKDHELTGVTLYNPFEENNNVELMQIDSVKKTYGAPNTLRAYFHINGEYFLDRGPIDRVIVYKNGLERFRLSPGNDSTFVESSGLLVNGEYDFQLSVLFKDASITKRTSAYVVVY